MRGAENLFLLVVLSCFCASCDPWARQPLTENEIVNIVIPGRDFDIDVIGVYSDIEIGGGVFMLKASSGKFKYYVDNSGVYKLDQYANGIDANRKYCMELFGLSLSDVFGKGMVPEWAKNKDSGGQFYRYIMSENGYRVYAYFGVGLKDEVYFIGYEN